MNQPEDPPSSTRDWGSGQRPAQTDHQPMQRAWMQGKLPPEVDVTAHPQQPKHHLGTEDQPIDGSRLDGSRLDTLHLDRRAALDLLAGEVSHELAHTLIFLRCLAEEPGSPESRALSSEDGQLARRQIERVQRMQRHLRPVSLPPPPRGFGAGVDTWELVVIANEGRAGFRLLIPAASFCLESAR